MESHRIQQVINAVNLLNSVVSDKDKVYTGRELSSAFAKVEEQSLLEAVAEKHDNTMQLMFGCDENYYLFHRRGNDTFTYAQQVMFIPSVNDKFNMYHVHELEPAVVSAGEPPELIRPSHLCDVCGKNEMAHVAASVMGPISFAYCQDCLNKGAEPYGSLIASIACIYGVKDWEHLETQDYFRNKESVIATLEVAGKTFEQFVVEAHEAIIKFDEEMNEAEEKFRLQEQEEEPFTEDDLPF